MKVAISLNLLIYGKVAMLILLVFRLNKKHIEWSGISAQGQKPCAILAAMLEFSNYCLYYALKTLKTSFINNYLT